MDISFYKSAKGIRIFTLKFNEAGSQPVIAISSYIGAGATTFCNNLHYKTSTFVFGSAINAKPLLATAISTLSIAAILNPQNR